MSLLENHPYLLTVEETAEILRTTPAVVEDFITAGKLKYTEIAEKPLILRSFLENLIENSCQKCYNKAIEESQSSPIQPRGKAP